MTRGRSTVMGFGGFVGFGGTARATLGGLSLRASADNRAASNSSMQRQRFESLPTGAV
jgi:hypothetical protein